MAIVNASINFNTVNVSAQVGDTIYNTEPSGMTGGFNQSPLSNTHVVGPIISITMLPDGTTDILVQYDDSNTTFSPASTNDFISFGKNKKVNTSSLLGYYASVNFVNDSTGKVELFSVGSEVSESSK